MEHLVDSMNVDYSIFSLASGEETVWVRDVPVEAVRIDGNDNEPLDAIVMRCIPTAKRFVEAAIAAGFVLKKDVIEGRVIVSVERTDDADSRGDVYVETFTDLYTFTPANRSLAAGPQFVPVPVADFLEDIETPSAIQVRLVRDLMLAEHMQHLEITQG
ncbi:hypothetical protein AB4Y43_17075 [Paraburkholderia sp. BR10872]|uniref:hypothetical protein n=1 Tax=Paraburkholderia sp. BR10872 TaxID=3236989 RepID=UPI0034D1E6F4